MKTLSFFWNQAAWVASFLTSSVLMAFLGVKFEIDILLLLGILSGVIVLVLYAIGLISYVLFWGRSGILDRGSSKSYLEAKKKLVFWLEEHAGNNPQFNFRAKLIYKYRTPESRSSDETIRGWTDIDPPETLEPKDAQKFICEMCEKGVLEPGLSRSNIEILTLIGAKGDIANVLDRSFKFDSPFLEGWRILRSQGIAIAVAIASVTYAAGIRELAEKIGLMDLVKSIIRL